MKKLTTWLALATLLLAVNVTFLKAENANDPAVMDQANTELATISTSETSQAILSIPDADLAMVSSATAAENAYANTLTNRLNEINEMDFSAMSLAEKNELRKEVRAIQKEQAPSGGIYVSVGAAILIVLLLILLL